MSLDLQNKLKGLKDFDLDAEVANTISEINKYRTENHSKRGVLTEKEINSSVGSNGQALGDEITFTGEIDLAVPFKNDKGEVISTYIGAKTTTGTWFSIRRMMGISSMKGYFTEGTFPHETGKKKFKTQGSEDFDASYNVVNVKAEVVEGFDFSDVYQPEDRNLYRFATMLKATNALQGVTIKYLGSVVKPYRAKSANPPEAFETWFKDAQRVMETPLYAIV
jgi:hypothetical protein